MSSTLSDQGQGHSVTLNGTPPDKFGALYRELQIEFHSFNSRIDVSGLSHFGS